MGQYFDDIGLQSSNAMNSNAGSGALNTSGGGGGYSYGSQSNNNPILAIALSVIIFAVVGFGAWKLFTPKGG